MEMLQRKKYSKIGPSSTRTAIGLVPKRPESNRGTHTCKRERAKGIRTENAQYKKDPSILKISRSLMRTCIGRTSRKRETYEVECRRSRDVGWSQIGKFCHMQRYRTILTADRVVVGFCRQLDVDKIAQAYTEAPGTFMVRSSARQV